jgi:hypothetical protein
VNKRDRSTTAADGGSTFSRVVLATGSAFMPLQAEAAGVLCYLHERRQGIIAARA